MIHLKNWCKYLMEVAFYRALWVTFLSLLLAGCFTSQEVIDTSTLEPTRTVVASLLPTQTVLSTQISEYPWLTKCGTQRTGIPGGENLPGDIFVMLTDSSYRKVYHDLTFSNSPFGSENNLRVSPSGNWLSYEDSGRETVIFQSTVDEQQYVIPLSDNLLVPTDPWISDNHFRLIEINEDDSRRSYAISIKGERKEIEWPNLPGLIQTSSKTNMWGNPTFSHVLYKAESLRIWDFLKEEIVWENSGNIYIFTPLLVWSPNGEVLAFPAMPEEYQGTGKYEIYTLTVNGDLKRRTFFGEYFETYELRELKWSFDNEKLLFNFTNAPNTSEGFITSLILDTESGDTINYCLPTGQGAFQPWSLDNSLVAFVGLIDHRLELIILDVESGDVITTNLDACQKPICDYPSDVYLSGVLGWVPPESNIP